MRSKAWLVKVTQKAALVWIRCTNSRCSRLLSFHRLPVLIPRLPIPLYGWSWQLALISLVYGGCIAPHLNRARPPAIDGRDGYSFVANMVKENVGTEGMKYFPFIFSLFMFILFCNMLGMVPY
jgi:hypothetical protein